MGLDSYIFKTTKQQAIEKRKEIFEAKSKAMAQGVNIGGVMFFTCDCSEYIKEAKPDIYWRKYNHISAWISEKVFKNPKGDIIKFIDEISKADLLKLREDCRKVLEHCIMSNGEINIDETYCKNIFPCLTGYFTGSVLYDQYFIEDIKNAMNDIDRLLLTSYHPDTVFIFFMDY